MKIALVSVLTPNSGDYSNHGASSRHNYMTLYSDCTLEQAYAHACGLGKDLDECLYFVKEKCCGDWNYFAIPIKAKEPGMVGPMFGGNWVYTSNSNGTFPLLEGLNQKVPIRVHDRYETSAEYEALSR